jgi:hypothetical protein
MVIRQYSFSMLSWLNWRQPHKCRDIEGERQARPFLVAVAEEPQNTVGQRGIPSNSAEPAPNRGPGLKPERHDIARGGKGEARCRIRGQLTFSAAASNARDSPA